MTGFSSRRAWGSDDGAADRPRHDQLLEVRAIAAHGLPKLRRAARCPAALRADLARVRPRRCTRVLRRMRPQVRAPSPEEIPADRLAGPIVIEDEVLSTPLDKRRAGAGFPGEGYRRRTGSAPGRPVLWNAQEAVAFAPAPVWGAYPVGFSSWATRAIGVTPAEVLHVCSGALGADVGGMRIDLRAAARPDVRADGRALPFRANTFNGVLIDPPYSLQYSRELYGVEYPRPSALLREAARVLRPNGRVGFLHFLVPSPQPGLSLAWVRGVTQGCGYRIRAFTVFVKRGADLFDEATS